MTHGGATANGGAQSFGGNAAQGGAANGGTSSAGANTGGASGQSSAGSAGTSATGGNAGNVIPGTCAPPVAKDAPYARLSETGCVDPAHPTQFSSRVLPYEVNSPLWSDSADKTRGMVLPSDGKIRVLDCAVTPAECAQGPADSGRWIFPPGTVMIKNFLFDGKFVETRLFVQFSDKSWVGYSYAWNEAQTDAILVPSERMPVTFNTGKRSVDWTMPSRKDCMKCHLPEAGFVLGGETAQLNRVVDGTNQIDRWEAQGLFEEAPAKPYQAALVTPYPGPLGSPPANATLEQKARSYLHANCAFCHRTDGAGPSFDIRSGLSLADTQTCNMPPTKGDQGVVGALLITPGKPETSIMYLRMETVEANSGRMPPIASAHADADGLKLVGDWIKSISACP
jgi:uncharacterized repeat protein (TIGR03806 family)